MKKEDKEILLRDLCARLPYGVKMRNREMNCDFELDGKTELTLTQSITYCVVKFNSVPYLRPMSSMTNKESAELSNIYTTSKSDSEYIGNCTDYLLSHHFDYRGLIPMGLAIKAPEGMYNFNKEEKK